MRGARDFTQVVEENICTVNLANGILLLDYVKGKPNFISHDPAYNFMYILPYVYDDGADCPKFKIFLQQQVEEEPRKHLLKYLASIFTRHKIEKICTLHGATGSGKDRKST